MLGLPGRSRTDNLQFRRLMLYPIELQADLASLEGLEPPTCSLEDCHSIQLSYRDILTYLAPLVGFEPT